MRKNCFLKSEKVLQKKIVKNNKKARRQVLVKGYSKVWAKFQLNRCIGFPETLLTVREGSHFLEKAFSFVNIFTVQCDIFFRAHTGSSIYNRSTHLYRPLRRISRASFCHCLRKILLFLLSSASFVCGRR